MKLSVNSSARPNHPAPNVFFMRLQTPLLRCDSRSSSVRSICCRIRSSVRRRVARSFRISAACRSYMSLRTRSQRSTTCLTVRYLLSWCRLPRSMVQINYWPATSTSGNLSVTFGLSLQRANGSNHRPRPGRGTGRGRRLRLRGSRRADGRVGCGSRCGGPSCCRTGAPAGLP